VKYLDEYRDGRIAAKVVAEIRRLVTRPWTLMEVCGGQTHSIVKHGVDRLLPPEIELVHGPGCPVCVTPLEQIDKAHAIARRPGVIFTSFGDMLRVPGSRTDLLRLKSEGADVRVVYAPLDAVKLAQQHADREVVFFAIGFETTAPANALAVTQARALGVTNFSMLVSHVLVPPAITAVLQSPGNRVGGFLGPGHVCTVMGYREYEPIARHYGVPIVITGFEPIDLLDGVLRTVRLLEAGEATVDVASYQAKRDRLCDFLGAAGYDAPRPQGSYYVFPKTPIADDLAFIGRLQEEGILAVPGRGFGRAGYMRLSLTIDRESLERSLPGFARAMERVREEPAPAVF